MASGRNGAGLSTERDWCRNHIEHFCIFRSPVGQPLLTSAESGRNSWQFYFPIATLDQQFCACLGLLFWAQHLEQFRQRPFQLAACESGGTPVACALQAAAYASGIAVNVIESKKREKSYGLRNWLEGVVTDAPVLLVDDVVGGKRTITAHAKRLRSFGLEVIGAFCVASCKHKLPLTIELDTDCTIPVTALFGPDDFTRSYEVYTRKYRRPPQFKGTVV